MASWRNARCLDDLLHEVNAVAPHRAKGRDGTIGNADHQARASRHNPNAAGVVTARDVTDDPAGGMPIHVYVRALIARPDLIPNDLDYIISNRQVASREKGWVWREYVIPKGGDAHDLHAHFGVGRGPDSAPVGPYDDPSNWHVADLLAGHLTAQSQTPATPLQEDDMYDDKAKALAEDSHQRLVNLASNGMFDWDAAGGDSNGIGITTSGQVLQVLYANGKYLRRVLIPKDAVAIFAGPRQPGPHRTEVQVELKGGTIRWLTIDSDRDGFPGQGDLPDTAHLVKDGDGWHYVDVSGPAS